MKNEKKFEKFYFFTIPILIKLQYINIFNTILEFFIIIDNTNLNDYENKFSYTI